jgi:hypothetical protein
LTKGIFSVKILQYLRRNSSDRKLIELQSCAEEGIRVSKPALLLGIFLGLVVPAFSQQPGAATAGVVSTSTDAAPLNPRRLSPENAYARVYCIVPMVGSGTLADPIRPMFAPLPPTPTAAIDRTGIIAFQFQLSDDGNFALAEFVAVTRAGLAVVLGSANPNVIAFERGVVTQAQVEAAFQKYKKSFSFKNFMPVRTL